MEHNFWFLVVTYSKSRGHPSPNFEKEERKKNTHRTSAYANSFAETALFPPCPDLTYFRTCCLRMAANPSHLLFPGINCQV